MTIDEAIKHAEEVADSHDRIKQIKAVTLEECRCAGEHRQLAEWLKELKAHREAWEKITGIISKWKDGVGGVVVAKDVFSDILDLINNFKPKEGDAE